MSQYCINKRQTALDIGWSLASAMMFPVFIHDQSLSFSNSFFSWLLFASIYLITRYSGKQKYDKRLLRFTLIEGTLFACLTTWGFALRQDGWGEIKYSSLPLIVSVILFSRVYSCLLGLIWQRLGIHESSICSRNDEKKVEGKQLSFLRVLFSNRLLLIGVFILCWLPCYLSIFPGNFFYDASFEYYQLRDGFTRSFPLLHSAIITRILYASERLTGSYNAGIATYTIAQMLFAAALFAHILKKLYGLGLPPLVLTTITAYYALFPTIHLILTCTVRDVLFSILITWLVYLLFLFVREPEFFSLARNRFCLSTVLVFTVLARNNNSGPLLPFLLAVICILLCWMQGKRHLKKSLSFTVMTLVLFFGANQALEAICQPLYNPPPSFAMSLPAQMIVRTYMLHKDEWPEEDVQQFESFFTMETLEYFPQNADPAKGNLQIYYSNLRPFLRLFIKIGLKYPSCYMDALLSATRQMWFPDAVIDGYSVRKFDRYEKSYLYFGQQTEEIGTRMNLLPHVFAFYEKIGLWISFEKIPVISMLFSIGFQVWCLLNAVFYVAYRKCTKLLLPLMILLLYTLISAFTPLVLLRYFAALFLSAPFILLCTAYPTMLLSSAQIAKH